MDAQTKNKPIIAVFGDFMVDIDHHCVCERLCQEGPWPVLKVLRTEKRHGGAGNVGEMLKALGCDVVQFGVGGQLTQKRRFFIDDKLIGPRIDDDAYLTAMESEVIQWMSELERIDPHAVIVADHGKGSVTKFLMECLAKQGRPVFIDPVKTTPIVGDPAAIAGGVHELNDESYNADVRIVKLGAKGVRWSGQDRGELPSAIGNAVDPLGAGDQFIAVLAWMRCKGENWSTSIAFANLAAGMQCLRRGCVPVTEDELNHEMANRCPYLESCRPDPNAIAEPSPLHDAALAR